MKVSSVRWQGVRVPFREPFVTAAGVVEARYSLLVWLQTDAGVVGIGEAPLMFEGGEEGLKQLAATLRELSPSLMGLAMEEVHPVLGGSLGEGPDARALGFALETAAYDAIGRSKGQPLAALLGGRPRPVQVNAVIGATSPELTSALAARFVAEGYRTLKLKVGGRPISEEVATLDAVRRSVGDEISLRLDANRAWGLEEAVSSIGRLASFSPEYIEDPLRADDLSVLAQVKRSSQIPIAADETVESREAANRIIESGAADVLVIKAARLGGLEDVRKTVVMATKNGIRTVITSSLETGVGLAASIHLAAATLKEEEACGLATSPLLEHDLLTTPLLPRNGFVHTPVLPGLGISIDTDALKRYSVGLESQITS